MNLQNLIEQYGADWLIRPVQNSMLATRRRRLPDFALRDTDLAMTILASGLTELAEELAEQAAEAERFQGASWLTT